VAVIMAEHRRRGFGIGSGVGVGSRIRGICRCERAGRSLYGTRI